jgi:hypothetical protein
VIRQAFSLRVTMIRQAFNESITDFFLLSLPTLTCLR